MNFVHKNIHTQREIPIQYSLTINCWCCFVDVHRCFRFISISHFFNFFFILFILPFVFFKPFNPKTIWICARVCVCVCMCESSRARAHSLGCNTLNVSMHSSIWRKKYGTHQFNCILDFNSFKQILMGSVLDSNALDFIYIFFSDLFPSSFLPPISLCRFFCV